MVGLGGIAKPAQEGELNENRPGKQRSIFSRRTKALLTLGLSAGAIWFANKYDLLHIRSPDFDDVEVSRYVLGRWPHNWQEVRKSVHIYGRFDVGDEHFEAVRFQPLLGDQCVVKFRFRNIIGFPYEESRKLTWSAEQQKLRAHDEYHTSVAYSLAASYCQWVKTANSGKLSSSMDGIRDRIKSESDPSTRRAPVKKIALYPGGITLKGRGSIAEVPSLVISYADGEVRRVPIKHMLTRSFKGSMDWLSAADGE